MDRKTKFQMGGLMGKGRPVDLGVTAIVKVKNLHWLISANISAINLDPFEQFGMDHLDFDLVLLRSKPIQGRLGKRILRNSNY